MLDITDQPSYDPAKIKELTGIVPGAVAGGQGRSLLALAACGSGSTYGSTMAQALRTVLPVRQKTASRREIRTLVTVTLVSRPTGRAGPIATCACGGKTRRPGPGLLGGSPGVGPVCTYAGRRQARAGSCPGKTVRELWKRRGLLPLCAGYTLYRRPGECRFPEGSTDGKRLRLTAEQAAGGGYRVGSRTGADPSARRICSTASPAAARPRCIWNLLTKVVAEGRQADRAHPGDRPDIPERCCGFTPGSATGCR